MKKILSLTKVMLKNTNMGLESGKKNQKKWQRSLAYLGIAALFIILAISIYFISRDTLLALKDAGLETIAIQIVMIGLSMYLLIGGIITVPLVFYFSKDVENLLALPLRPFEILSAKTITTYINLLISTSFIVLPFGIAYQMIVQPSLVFGVFYFLAFLILPIIPLTISILVIVTLFTVFPKINNKDFFTYFTSFSMILVVLFFNLNSGGDGSQTGQIVMDNLGFINRMPKLIPTIGLLIHAVTYFDSIALLGALLISVALAFSGLRLVDGLYFKGVVGAQVTSNKKKKRKDVNKAQSQLVAIMKIDVQKIMRTPSLAINYLLPIFLIPLLLVVPLIVGVDSNDIEVFKQLLIIAREALSVIGGLNLVPFLIFFSFIITYSLSSLSTITSTAISREGETMQTYKSMPVSLLTLVKAKIILGMIVGAIFPVILAILVSVLLRLNIIAVIIIFVSIFVALAFSNTSDIIFDMYKPKLEWDDEIQAVKQNFIAVIPMFLSFGVTGLLIFVILTFNALYSSIFILILAALMTIFNYKIMIENYAMKQLEKAIQKL